ncbi:LemA family protein [Parvicella tangerina]|uniref:Tetratricopeptide repeat protein n=1 Tax=Parvicella tangerina TaxID=2829795 RepID=A0A916JQ75_9FLAO|nr:LemA family protein [Parvicella tangerina]CAG5086626.1 hypothetical protein CRYO30217_03209 [Parvicella tangerina]
MDTFDEIIQKHMLSVKQMGILEGEIDISKEELKEISQDLGMTADDWEQVMKEADERLALAQSHMQHKSYRECLKTAQDALLLNPYILGARGLQAKSYLLLAINEEDDSYLDQAKSQAQITLDKEPKDKNALEVMATVSSKTRLSNMDKKKNPNKKLALILGVLIVALIGFVGIYFIAGSSAEEQSNSKLENVEKQLESAFEKQEALVPKVKALLSESDEDQKKRDELDYVLSELDDDLSLKDRYDLQVQLGGILSEIIYSKSMNTDSKTLDDLRVLLEGAENRIKTERKHYNDAITTNGLKTEKL